MEKQELKKELRKLNERLANLEDEKKSSNSLAIGELQLASDVHDLSQLAGLSKELIGDKVISRYLKHFKETKVKIPNFYG